MEQQDYLKRQINMIGLVLGQMLADLLRLKGKGKMNEGIEQTHQYLRSELDIDLNVLLDIPPHGFMQYLREEKGFSNENAEQLAEIFLIIADHEPVKSRREKCYEKALTILEFLEDTESVYSFSRKWKIERIKQQR